MISSLKKHFLISLFLQQQIQEHDKQNKHDYAEGWITD